MLCIEIHSLLKADVSQELMSAPQRRVSRDGSIEIALCSAEVTLSECCLTKCNEREDMFREKREHFLPVFYCRRRIGRLERDNSEKVIYFWIGRRQTRGVLQMLLSFLAMVCAQFFEPLQELPLWLWRKQWRLCGDGPARRIREQAQSKGDLLLIIPHD